MHVSQIRWWMMLSLLFGLIEALNFTDLGLPNNSNCAFTYNNTLYIIGDNNVSISFGNPWDVDVPKVSKQNNNTPTTAIACATTRSGRLVLVPFSNSNSLQVIDNVSLAWQPNQNITYQGSQNAINKFITKSWPISHFILAAFNDYVLIQAETTFILDTRFPTQWTWYELLNTSLSPPPLPSTNSSLVATSRWILHFRTVTRSSSTGYTTFVNCFDPLSFTWLGEILSFNTTTNLIQPSQIQSSAEGSDSLLLFPSWTPGTQDLNSSETAATTNNYADAIFWKLDISTWIHTNVTLTPIVISQHENDTLFEPVPGSTITRLDKDLAVIYGGSSNNIQFFNTTSFTFMPKPQWLFNETTPKSENSSTTHNDLAIILGSVMGSVIFIAILILFIYCCLKRKRSRDTSIHLTRHIDTHKNKCLHWPLLIRQEKQKKVHKPGMLIMHQLFHQTSNKKKLIFLEGQYVITKKYEPSNPPYILSPIPKTSPISLFPPEQSTSKAPPMKSKFVEHFDYDPLLLLAKAPTDGRN